MHTQTASEPHEEIEFIPVPTHKEYLDIYHRYTNDPLSGVERDQLALRLRIHLATYQPCCYTYITNADGTVRKVAKAPRDTAGC